MIGSNGALLGPRRVPTRSSASGLWVPDEQVLAKRAGAWPATGSDPLWSQVELLIRGNGVNNSTQITDISPRPKTVTIDGNVRILTNFSKFHGSSIYFDGTGDRLRLPGTGVLSTGADDYCWEAWVRCEGNLNTYGLLWSPTGGTNTSGVEYIYLDNLGKLGLQWLINGSRPEVSNTGVTYNADFQHLVAQRRAGVMQVWVNGSPSTTAVKGGPNAGASSPWIGENAEEYGTNGRFRGWMNEIRFTKAARYEGTFDPPSAPFPDF